MFRDCFFPTRKTSIEKKNKNKKDFVKNKVFSKPAISPIATMKDTLKRGYESCKDSVSFDSASVSSTLMEISPAHLAPATETTVTSSKKYVPKKLHINVASLKTGLLRAKECLRKISPLSKSPVARFPSTDLVTPMDTSSPPTPRLVETPVRQLPKYRLRTIRRRLFQDDSSSSSISSLCSVLSGITERTQTNQTATVSFESDFEMHISMASIRRLPTVDRMMNDDASGRERSWNEPSPPAEYKDTPHALFFPMDEGDMIEEEKDVQSMDRLSVAENSSYFMDGGVGDICTLENSKTDSSWTDARTPERECDKEYWTQKLSLHKFHRKRSTPRILFPEEDIYDMNDYETKFKKINRRLSFSSY